MSSHTTKGVFNHLSQMLHVWNIYTGVCSMYIHRINADINMCVLVISVRFFFFLKATRECELLRPPQTQPTKSGPWYTFILPSWWLNQPPK